MKRDTSAKPMNLLVIPARLERATYCLEGNYKLSRNTSSNLSTTDRKFPQTICLSWDYVGTKPNFVPVCESVASLSYRIGAAFTRASALGSTTTIKSTQFQFATQEFKKSGGIFMRWFKHYVDTGDSSSLATFRRATGREGMCRYWDLISFLASKFDGETCHFVIPRESLQKVMGFRSWTGLASFADQLATIPGLNVRASGNDYEIDAPILLDLLGRDFRVARQARASTALKTKTKKEIKNKKTTTAVANHSLGRRSTTELVSFNSLTELLGAFDKETVSTWSQLYPDNEYLQRQSIKAWDYYRTNSVKTPKNLKGWKRAMNHWFESDWPKHVRNIQSVPKSTRIEDILNDDNGASA